MKKLLCVLLALATLTGVMSALAIPASADSYYQSVLPKPFVAGILPMRLVSSTDVYSTYTNTYTYQYDDLGRMVTSICATYDHETQETKPDNRATYSYDEKGRVIEVSTGYYSKSKGDWGVDENRRTFTYDENGRVATSSSFSWDDGWDKERTQTYTYDEDGKMTSYVQDDYDDSDETPSRTVNYVFTYDNEGRITKEECKTGQLVESQYVYTYDGDVAYRVYSQYDPYDKVYWYAYDRITQTEENGVITVIIEHKDSEEAEYVNDWRNDCEYDEYGNLLKDAAYDYNEENQDWELSSTVTNVYANVGPTLLAGDNQTVTSDGTTDLTFSSDAPLAQLQKVTVDGVVLTANTDYTATSGSTIITLKASFIETLEAGAHTLSIVSKYGSVSATFTVVEPAADKKESNLLWLWITLGVVAVAGAAGGFVFYKKKKK